MKEQKTTHVDNVGLENNQWPLEVFVNKLKNTNKFFFVIES